MQHSAIQNNGNLLCAIDVETTGLQFGRNELIQICILPLGPDLKPSPRFRHFEMMVKPEKLHEIDPVADKINKGLCTSACIHGMERWSAVDFVGDYFRSLKLPERKKIIPLGCNYCFDRDFIIEFLGGPLSYEEYFRSDFRDVQIAAHLINDWCDWFSERIPFPKTKLSYLCSCLGVEHINKHDATGDALATAEVYRRLMRYKDYWDLITRTRDQYEAANPGASTDSTRGTPCSKDGNGQGI